MDLEDGHTDSIFANDLHIFFILIFKKFISRKLHFDEACQIVAVHSAFVIRPCQSRPAILLIFNNNQIRAAVNPFAGHREGIGGVASTGTVFFQ